MEPVLRRAGLVLVAAVILALCGTGAALFAPAAAGLLVFSLLVVPVIAAISGSFLLFRRTGSALALMIVPAIACGIAAAFTFEQVWLWFAGTVVATALMAAIASKGRWPPIIVVASVVGTLLGSVLVAFCATALFVTYDCEQNNICPFS